MTDALISAAEQTSQFLGRLALHLEDSEMPGKAGRCTEVAGLLAADAAKARAVRAAEDIAIVRLLTSLRVMVWQIERMDDMPEEITAIASEARNALQAVGVTMPEAAMVAIDRADWIHAYTNVNQERLAMLQLLRKLVPALESEFETEETVARCSDDESVYAGTKGSTSRLTFGLIRKGRDLIDRQDGC